MVGGPLCCGMSLGTSISPAGRVSSAPAPREVRSCHTPSLFRGANSELGPYSCCHSASASAAFR
eukprot:1845872-Lingulodinium_polyedra.AAC.1